MVGYDGNALGPFLVESAVRRRRGLFSLVSQISPTGDPILEDLPVLDPSDPAQFMLIAVERRGDDLLIDRRLYRAGAVEEVIGTESASPATRPSVEGEP
jgi:hypothetical protein